MKVPPVAPALALLVWGCGPAMSDAERIDLHCRQWQGGVITDETAAVALGKVRAFGRSAYGKGFADQQKLRQALEQTCGTRARSK